MTDHPEFSINEIPFSHHQSWLNISPVIAEHRRADDLHLITHRTGMHAVLALVPFLGGQRIETTVTATPSTLSWVADTGRIDAVFDGPDTVRLRGRGLSIKVMSAIDALTPFSGSYFFADPVSGALVWTHYESGRRYRLTTVNGQTTVLGDQAVGTAERGAIIDVGPGEGWEIAIEEFSSAAAPFVPGHDFDHAVTAARQSFGSFVQDVAPWRSHRTPAAVLAAYVVWSATVGPAGFLHRPSVLMSKHWMDKVWSWDHCFNAIALASGRPDLALDQFLTPFDHQDSNGALPDSITHSEVLFNFVKPPIHGWALQHLRRRLPQDLTFEQLTTVYTKLADWTSFWLQHRRAPGHVLAHYQHGNDSGWDNSTLFDFSRVAETADLAAFLVQQMGVLADLAQELALPLDAFEWHQQAEQMAQALLTELWDGQSFAAKHPVTGQVSRSASLLNLLPVTLGDKLPAPVHQQIARSLGAHLTPWGPATEPPASPDYQPDGYWRGPIWAPSTVLLEDGLRRAGHTELADQISNRFRALCEKSGFAENFDAITGEGLRDRAYTWTASAYLILAADHEHRRTAIPQQSARL